MTAVAEARSLEELAACVCAALERHGVQVVLSGGAVVSIYSNNEFESYDLDFIMIGLASKVDGAMHELGFSKEGRHWTHPDTDYWVEFPSGPVQVGDAIITEFAERQTPFGTLRLLKPADCIMDRLASYYHWNDPQGLDQAVLVARRQRVDLGTIEKWSRREGAEEKWRLFLERLEGG